MTNTFFQCKFMRSRKLYVIKKFIAQTDKTETGKIQFYLEKLNLQKFNPQIHNFSKNIFQCTCVFKTVEFGTIKQIQCNALVFVDLFFLILKKQIGILKWHFISFCDV